MQDGMHTLGTLWGVFMKSDLIDMIEMKHLGFGWSCSDGGALGIKQGIFPLK